MTQPETMPNAFRPGAVELSPEDAALVARRAAALGPAYRLFYERPLHFVQGAGVWLTDASGRRYLDAYNNVASLGHSHPRVVAAMAAQAATYASHTRYLHEGILDYAERLLGHFPPDLAHVMFTCTGSEANDLALRIARAATGGEGVIVTENAYHGVTLAVAGASPSLGPGVARPDWLRVIPGPGAYDDPGTGMAQAVADAVADMAAHGIRPACLMVDTVFSSDGVFPDPAGFLAPAVAAIRAAGGLFLADEVQPGFGRLGHGMWGFARHGVVPDMVSLGKPMGNGYPMAGLVLRPDVVAEFGAKARYFNTFGGNAVAAAVGMAVLDVLRDEGLIANAARVGAHFAEGLRASGAFGAVRAAGLFIGADVLDANGAPDAVAAGRIVNGLRDEGVLISATGPKGHVLKIRPPLCFSDDDAGYFLAALGRVLGR